MQEKQFYSLLKKHRSGKASQEEIDLLNAYYNLFQHEPDGLGDKTPGETDRLRDLMETNIRENMETATDNEKPGPHSFRFLWVAAAIVAIVFAGGLIYFAGFRSRPLSEKYSRYNIVPGKNNVVLTLADGRKMVINPSKTGTLATQGSITVISSSAGILLYKPSAAGSDLQNGYNTISVPEGRTLEVVLADNSRVFLNAGSSLRYHTQFAGSKRIVELEGEAYFEVSHNREKPFVVKTNNQDVEVLGTHFNLSAYSDEEITKTTLLEGSVKVSSKDEAITLRPGQQSRFTGGAGATHFELVPAVDTSQAVAWKNGLFQYQEANIKTIMQDLSRWYGVKVIYQGNIHERLFSGGIHKNLSLLQALDILNYTHVRFTIEDKQITITSN